MILAGRTAPFGAFYDQTPTAIAEVTASLELQPNGFFKDAPLSGGPYLGTIGGRFVGVGASNVSGRGGAGAVFTFVLRGNTADIMFGVAAAQANLI